MKEMTASELLRDCARRSTRPELAAAEYYFPETYVDDYTCDLCSLFRVLADKIDAELSQAREKGRQIVVCDHCSEESKPIIKTDDLTVYVDAFLGKLYVNHYNGQMWECETADIDDCPMCRRDLRGGDHD